jgi:hypothetical protein
MSLFLTLSRNSGLVEFEGEYVFAVYVDFEEGGLVVESQLFRDEFASVVEVAVVDLVEMFTEILEQHVEQTVIAVVGD